jgi:hypothetical protein
MRKVENDPHYGANKIYADLSRDKDKIKADHSDFGRFSDLNSLILFPTDERLATLPMDARIIGRANALYLEQHSHREVVDQLTTEGYNRELVITLIRRMATKGTIQSNLTAPVILLALASAAFAWAQLPSSEFASHEFTMLKVLTSAVTMVAIPALFGVVVYHYYDRIPGLDRLLEPIFHKHRALRTDVVAVDEQFVLGQLHEHEYERRLVTLMGKGRGKRHFRIMRNQKHFGLE